jgi:hypothetical protein
MKKSKLVLFGFATALVVAPLGYAESYTGNYNANPFANAAPAPSSQTNSPRSNPGDAHFFTSTSTIFDDSAGNAANGREYKLQDATRQANVGQAGAIAAGTALSAAGANQLALMNYPEAARLFGLAGMEFAQAGINSGTAAANTGLRTTLLSESGQTSAQSSYNPSQVAQTLMTPSTVAAFQAQGIDPNLFFNNLASGNVRSGADAYAALGQDPSSLTPDTLNTINDTSGEDLKGILDQVGLGVNEGAVFNSDGGVASRSPNGVGNSGSSNTHSDTLNQPSKGNGGLPSQNGTLASRGLGSSSGSNGQDGLAGAHAGLGNMFGSFGAEAKDADSVGGNGGTISRSDLLNIGVVKAKGQTIFRVANRNYHSFLKWRTMRYPKAKQPAVARGIASIP